LSLDLHHVARRTGRTVAQVETDAKALKLLNDTEGFGKHLFSKGEGWLYPNLPIPEFQKQGLRLLESGNKKVAWIWPRGHMKTTWKRIHYIRKACYRQKRYIAVFAAIDSNKKGWAQSIRSVFTDQWQFPEFHWLLPYFFDGKDPIVKANEDELVLSNGVRFDFRSLGGEARGLNTQGRPDQVELDDVLKSEAAHSDAVREKITDTLFSVVNWIGSADAHLFASATIMHKMDYWSLVSDGVIGGWAVQRLKAHEAIGDYSNILWPERWSAEALQKEYESYVKAGRVHLYAREMLNDPASASTHPFANCEFGYYRPDALPMDRLYRVVSIDHSSGTGGDDFAICETGEDDKGNIYVLDMYLNNTITMPGKLAQVEMFLRRRKPHRLVIGRTSESMAFINVLIPYLRAKNIHINIDEPTEVAAKNERMRSQLEPRYLSKTIHHPQVANAQWVTKLETALRSLDVTTDNNYDDPIDVLARCVEYSKAAQPFIIREQPPEDPRRRRVWDKMVGITPQKKEPEYPKWG
jgi:hypothetical protein